MKMRFLCFSLFAFLLSGCSALQTAAEYSELDVKATTERPVFVRYKPQKLFFALECPVIELASLKQNLEDKYRSNGYQLVATAAEADVILFVRVSDKSHDKISARAVQGRLDATSSAGAVGGAAIGFASSPTGDPLSTVVGGVAGFAVGTLADVTINSWVHLGVLDLNADVLVREKLPAAIAKNAQAQGADGYKETITRVNVKAKQTAIKWEEAAPTIASALTQELGRILPELNNSKEQGA